MFVGVTVGNAVPTPVTSSDGYVSFVGIYSSVSIGSNGDDTMLYIGVDKDDNSTLFYPNGEMTINSCRAYFQLNNGLVAGEPSSTVGINNFVFNFGDETNAIENIQSSTFNLRPEGWYTLDGRKLNNKPTQKGIYINNGQKFIIK